MRSLVNYISALCVLTASLAGCDYYPWPEKGSRDVIDLSGSWKIIETDTMQASSPEYDDSGARSVTIPGRWDSVLRKKPEAAGTVWLRKKVAIGDQYHDNQLVLSLGAISISDEAYFNGVNIGSTGFIPSAGRPLDYDFTWHYERNYTVNSSLVRYGQVNVIAIRVFSHFINGMKDAPGLYTMQGWHRSNWLKRYLPPINNLLPVIASLVLCIMLVVVAKGKVGSDVFLYSTLFVASVFIVCLLLLGLPPMSNGLYRFKLFFSLYSLIDLFLLLAVRGFFKITSKPPIAAILSCLVALNLLIFFAPGTKFFFHYCTIATLGFLAICVTYAFALLTIELYRDPRRYWLVYPFAVVVLLSALNTYYLVATGQMNRMSFMFIFRLTAIGLMVLLYFLLDLKQIEKERDSLTRALFNKTRELRSATKQIPSTKKKEDPRDIIHRLIEYVDANFTETYDRVKLAEKFGLNEDYMGQLFKKVTRTNIANYINCKRIEAAQQLLEETDSKVIDIAFHVGFDNLTYFYRHFKNKTGYNPTDYRKIKRGKFVELHFKNEADYY